MVAFRKIDPKRLTALLTGELDWVVIKCLQKDRDRRYESASGLGRDLQRYLANKIVEARPPSQSYRLKKCVQKYRGQVIAHKPKNGWRPNQKTLIPTKRSARGRC